MNKLKCVISAFPDAYTEIGKLSVNFIQALLATRGEIWDISIVSKSIVDTSMGLLDEYPDVIDYIVKTVDDTPDIWIEFGPPYTYNRFGRLFNIGVNIAPPTNLISKFDIDGINRMDLMLVLSDHAKEIVTNTKLEHLNAKGEIIAIDKVARPVEVLKLGVNKSVTDVKTSMMLSSIKEDFCFIYNGFWGNGYDINNISQLIYTFMNQFRTVVNKPALILKTQIKAPSISDVKRIINRIDQVREKFEHINTLPNVYLISGNVSDKDMMKIYNNEKVKAMVSCSSNEMLGLNLLEFNLTGKPIAAPSWGSHVNLLENAHLFSTEIKESAPGLISEFISKDSQICYPDVNELAEFLETIYRTPSKALKTAKYRINSNMKHQQMEMSLDVILGKYITNTSKSNYVPEIELFEI